MIVAILDSVQQWCFVENYYFADISAVVYSNSYQKTLCLVESLSQNSQKLWITKGRYEALLLVAHTQS